MSSAIWRSAVEELRDRARQHRRLERLAHRRGGSGRSLRATEGRRATVRDTPVLVGVHRDPRTLLSTLAS